MKTLVLPFAVLIALSVSADLNAKPSLPGHTTEVTLVNSTDEVSIKGRRERSDNDNLNRRQRARYQRTLEARSTDLLNWAVDLERREAQLQRRRVRERRIVKRFRLPRGRLNTQELRAWDARLEQTTNNLNAQERDLNRQERRTRRRGSRRGTRRDNRGNNNRGGYCPPGGW